MQRWKLTVEYFGAPYAGWQRQGDRDNTVQQRIEEAVAKFYQRPVPVYAAGRTDAGVHATGQVIHLDLDYGDRPLTPYGLLRAINAHLRPDPIAIVAAEQVEDDFHARYGAINKLYRYRLVTRPAPPIHDLAVVWHRYKSLNVPAMQEAAQHLLGCHDFTSFRAQQCQAKHPIRLLDRLDILVKPYDSFGALEINIETESKSFLHHQVRNMVGTLVLVGEGKWKPTDVKTALEARSRDKGGPTAPPNGLSLVRVDYS